MARNKIWRSTILSLCMIWMISLSSFAAIVSDNDGSAFVTKAEFEAMKNSFNSQITNYQESITSKIDGAIASYLAGIKTVKLVPEKNLLDAVDSYYFNKDFAIPTTRVGDYFGFYAKANIQGNNETQTSTTKKHLEAVLGTGNRDVPSYKYFGTNHSRFYVYQKDNTYSGKIYFQYCLDSYPTTTINLGYANTYEGCSTVENPTGDTYTHLSFKLDTASHDEFGTYNVSKSFKFSTNNSLTLSGTEAYQVVDTINTTDYDQYSLPGGSVFTDSVIKTILIDNVNKVGNAYTTTKREYDCRTGDSWVKCWKYELTVNGSVINNTITSYGGDGAYWPNFLTAYFMEHQYDNDCSTGATTNQYTTRSINLTDVSSLVGSFTTYGDGLPLFKASSTGRVKFKLKSIYLSGTETAPHFEIRKDKFNNTAIATTPFATLTDRNASIKLSSTTGDSQTWIIEFDVKDGEIYWISAAPQVSGKCNLDIDGSILNTPET